MNFPPISSRRVCFDRMYTQDQDRWGQYPSLTAKRFVSHILRERLLKRGSVLVDLGCGYGRDMFFFHDQLPSLHVTGIDFSEVAFQLFRDKTDIPEHMSSFEVKEVIDWFRDTPDSCVHYVFANYFFHMQPLNETTSIVEQAYRVIVNGGLFSASFVDENDRHFGKGVEIAPRVFDVEDGLLWYFFNKSIVEQLTRRAGFIPLTIERLLEVEMKRGEPDPVIMTRIVAQKP